MGTCQWCGSPQKLPGGVLAKHGYTVHNGWFQGTCLGSGTSPYEESCALIAQSITWARARRAQVVSGIDGVRALDPSGNEGWEHLYHPELSSRTRGCVYLWEFGRYEAKGEGAYFHDFVVGEKRHTTNPDRLASKVSQGNQAYIVHLQHQIVEIDAYVAHQQRRLEAWTPKPLTPILESVKEIGHDRFGRQHSFGRILTQQE
jgi:hypothetical protein